MLDRRTSARSWSHFSTAASAGELSTRSTELSSNPDSHSMPGKGLLPSEPFNRPCTNDFVLFESGSASEIVAAA